MFGSVSLLLCKFTVVQVFGSVSLRLYWCTVVHVHCCFNVGTVMLLYGFVTLRRFLDILYVCQSSVTVCGSRLKVYCSVCLFIGPCLFHSCTLVCRPQFSYFSGFFHILTISYYFPILSCGLVVTG